MIISTARGNTHAHRRMHSHTLYINILHTFMSLYHTQTCLLWGSAHYAAGFISCCTRHSRHMHSCKLVPRPLWLFQRLASIWKPRPLAECLCQQTHLFSVCLSALRLSFFKRKTLSSENSSKRVLKHTCLFPSPPSDQSAPAWVDI